jgi:amino-acid N-acetyltransferase
MSTVGISSSLKSFILAKSAKRIIGAVGVEIYDGLGYLRRLVVQPEFRGKGIGGGLCSRAVAHAHLRNVNELFLLTTTAQRFFAKLGFQKVDRRFVPAPIKSSDDYRTLCPVTTVCMKMDLGKRAIYFPRETLALEPDVPGAKMWGVALEKTLLTYFELAPRCRFARHRHVSEQVTMVLEGELFFELDKKTVGLKPGEVIAIPSNVPHSVFTRDKRTKAIDSWSPVMPQFVRSNLLKQPSSRNPIPDKRTDDGIHPR